MKSDKSEDDVNVEVPTFKSRTEILKHSLKGGAYAFLLAFGLRGGVTSFIKLVRVARGKETLYNALLAFFGNDSKRFGLMVGSFSFLWKLINNLLTFRSGRLSKLNGFIAGSIAGLSILFESKSNRIGIAQQFFMRSMQTLYNMLKTRNLFRFSFGDTALFSFACASIMYAYIMHPKTIPSSYYQFMVRTALVPEPSLSANRTNIKAWEFGKPTQRVDLADLKSVIQSQKFTPKALVELNDYVKKHDGFIPTVPCCILHPRDTYCLTYCLTLWTKVFYGILPVYSSLNAVPLLVLKLSSFIQKPRFYLSKALVSTLQSSAFLATFTTLFQSLCCATRYYNGDHPDNRFLYYLYGSIAGLSVLIEQKSRRADLAMYCLPKALQSLHTVMTNRGRMIALPHIDVVATSLGMGIIMSAYQVEPHQMSSLLYKIMRSILGTY